MIDDDLLPQGGDDNDPDDDGSAPTEQPTTSATGTTTVRRQRVKQLTEQEHAREFWSRSLRDPIGGKIIFTMLRDLHAFEDERFACGPNGFPQPDATEYQRGQRDFALRFYRTLVCYDREAVFALHDQLDPFFAKPKTARKPQRSE